MITSSSVASHFCPLPSPFKIVSGALRLVQVSMESRYGVPTYARQRVVSPTSPTTFSHLGTDDIGSNPLPLLQISNKPC